MSQPQQRRQVPQGHMVASRGRWPVTIPSFCSWLKGLVLSWCAGCIFRAWLEVEMKPIYADSDLLRLLWHVHSYCDSQWQQIHASNPRPVWFSCWPADISNLRGIFMQVRAISSLAMVCASWLAQLKAASACHASSRGQSAHFGWFVSLKSSATVMYFGSKLKSK